MTDRPDGALTGAATRSVRQSVTMRRLVAGTAVMAACSAAYALAGDLDVHRLRLALVLAAWWAAVVVVTRWVRRSLPDPNRPTGRRLLLVVFLVAVVVQLPGLLPPPRS